MVRLEQNAMANHFRHGCGVRGYNRFHGGHRLQKYDAKALLDAGQTEDVGWIVLSRELGAAHVADPGDEALDAQLACHTMQSPTLGPIADNPHFQLRYPAAE